jgi:DNA-binding MarR family transcriptional regulator
MKEAMHSGAYVTELVLRCHQFEKRVALTLGLSVDETHCLSQLYLHAPFCVRKLTELLGVSSTRMSRILMMMERKGLITRKTSPLDRRIEQVSLTDMGRTIVSRVMEISEESGSEIFNGLPSDEKFLPRDSPVGEFSGE